MLEPCMLRLGALKNSLDGSHFFAPGRRRLASTVNSTPDSSPVEYQIASKSPLGSQVMEGW